MKKIAIYGAGGLGKEVLTIINAINAREKIWDFLGYFDDGMTDTGIIGDIGKLNSWREPLHIVLAVGDPLIKKALYSKVMNPMIHYATLIHPRAILGEVEKIEIDDGCILTAGTVMTTDIQIGRHTLVNLNSTIGHDAVIGDYCSVMPGVNLAGNVRLEEAVFVGAGANVLNGITIGAGAKIGAGAVVNKDVLENTTVVGVPARALKG